VWVEDTDNEHIYHSEYVLQGRRQKDPIVLDFFIPLFEPMPAFYYVHVVSDRWLHAEAMLPLSLRKLLLPEQHAPHTELLDLQPLPVSALQSPAFQALYPMTHFNPIQTQVFHTLVHTDHNVLLGAPTGSGKTIAAEFAMLRLFTHYPHLKVVCAGVMEVALWWARRSSGAAA
jgi:activating signal cointegrator complex subunit 3